MATATKYQIAEHDTELRRLLRRMAWQWLRPGRAEYDWPAIDAGVAGRADPLIGRAWELIKREGRGAPQQVINSNDHNLIALFFALEELGPPAALRQKWHARAFEREKAGKGADDRDGDPAGASLAGDLWPDKSPVMVAPLSPFGGDYPKGESGEHVCSHHWVASGRGEHVTAIARPRFELWRPTMLKGELKQCAACWRDRVLNLCQQIERIAAACDPADLRYMAVADGKRETIGAKIRKHNQRGEGAPGPTAPVQFAAFPIAGRTVILHDGGGWLGGEALPADRGELFSIVETWAMTPEGKRVRGLTAWAAGLADKRPEEGRQGRGKGGGEAAGKGSDGEKRWRIVGANYDYLAALLYDAFDITTGPNGMRLKPGELRRDDLIALLDAAGVAYHCEGVTVSTVVEKADKDKDCTKRDIGPAGGGSGSEKPQPAPLKFGIIKGATC